MPQVIQELSSVVAQVRVVLARGRSRRRTVASPRSGVALTHKLASLRSPAAPSTKLIIAQWRSWRRRAGTRREKFPWVHKRLPSMRLRRRGVVALVVDVVHQRRWRVQ
jgi:hypothetical protein